MKNNKGVHEVYRHFDKKGRLLYVGVSWCALVRLYKHKTGSHWFDKIESITIERFSSHQKALVAEYEAIHKEKPKHNIRTNNGFLALICRTGKHRSAKTKLIYESFRDLPPSARSIARKERAERRAGTAS